MNILQLTKLLVCFFILQQGTYAQGIFQRKEPKVLVKSGPYLGIQSGRFYAAELGLERQWRRSEQLLESKTNALHMGVNYTYDFSHLNPVLGYDLGFWHKEATIGLTYGLNLCMRTNFDQYRMGICPTVGIKIMQFHIQTGYHILYPFTQNSQIFDSNTIFLSARFLWVNNRKRR